MSTTTQPKRSRKPARSNRPYHVARARVGAYLVALRRACADMLALDPDGWRQEPPSNMPAEYLALLAKAPPANDWADAVYEVRGLLWVLRTVYSALECDVLGGIEGHALEWLMADELPAAVTDLLRSRRMRYGEEVDNA